MKPMKIKEFAQNLGVTPELIKYYETQDIIQPIIDETNGYRYFYIHQTNEIYEAEKYRNLGYSIKEASDLIQSTSIVDLKKSFEMKQKEIETQALLLNYYNKELARQTALIDDYLNNNYYVINSPGFYFLPHTLQQSFLKLDETYSVALRDWHDYFPIVKHASIQALPLDTKSITSWCEAPFSHGFIIEESVYDTFRFSNDHAIYIPPRRCIKQVITFEKIPLDVIQADKEPSGSLLTQTIVGSILDKNDIHINGDIISIFEFFCTINNKKMIVYETYIPIE